MKYQKKVYESIPRLQMVIKDMERILQARCEGKESNGNGQWLGALTKGDAVSHIQDVKEIILTSFVHLGKENQEECQLFTAILSKWDTLI